MIKYDHLTFMGVQYSDFGELHRVVSAHIQESITQEILDKNDAGTLGTIDILEFLSFGLISQETIDIWRTELGDSFVHEAISGSRHLKFVESNFRNTLNAYDRGRKRVNGSDFYTSVLQLLHFDTKRDDSARNNAYALLFAIAGAYDKNIADEWRGHKEVEKALRLFVAGIPTGDIATYIEHDIDVETALAFDEPKRAKRQIQIDAYNRLIADIAAQS
jgi:hypothetical protein